MDVGISLSRCKAAPRSMASCFENSTPPLLKNSPPSGLIQSRAMA
jgi:hypothetical protein